MNEEQRQIYRHSIDNQFHRGGNFVPLSVHIEQLCEFARKGDVEAVKYFIEVRGINVDSRDTNEGTALIYASAAGFIDVVLYLINKKANINAQEEEGNTALHWAICYGKKSIVEILLNCPQIDATLQNNFGFTPIEWSIQYGQIHITEMLKQHLQTNFRLHFATEAQSSSSSTSSSC